MTSPSTGASGPPATGTTAEEPAPGAGSEPLVSVVIIFLDSERFLPEAIESVLSQTYRRWELVLVDDGSTDRSSDIARRHAAEQPDRIRYLEHPGHLNLGMSASRNLGIRDAAGSYIAFLDADDVWLPSKLNRQVRTLQSCPGAGMVYGLSQWWFSWTGRIEDRERDHVHELGVPAGELLRPGDLLPAFFFRQDAAIPGPSGILVRREAALRVGGFEEAFTGAYEDQAFYAKLLLSTPVVAMDECVARYRQHRAADGSGAAIRQAVADRLRFLDWLGRYMAEHDTIDRAGWTAFRRERRRCSALLVATGLPSIVGTIARRLASRTACRPVR